MRERPHRTAHAVLWAATAFTSSAALAAAPTVYRCGQTYQQWPCKDGREVAVADPRDDAQRQAALQAAAAERRTASELAAERREREKALLPARPAAKEFAPLPAAAVAAKDSDKGHGKSTGKNKPLRADDSTLYAPRGNKAAPVDGRIAPTR